MIQIFYSFSYVCFCFAIFNQWYCTYCCSILVECTCIFTPVYSGFNEMFLRNTYPIPRQAHMQNTKWVSMTTRPMHKYNSKDAQLRNIKHCKITTHKQTMQHVNHHNPYVPKWNPYKYASLQCTKRNQKKKISVILGSFYSNYKQ